MKIAGRHPIFVAVAMLGCSTGFATGAMAQVKPGDISPKQAARVAQDFSKCAYETDPKAAHLLLMHSDPATTNLKGAHFNAFHDLNMGRCLGNRDSVMTIQPNGLFFMLEEQEYLAHHPVAPTLPSSSKESPQREFVSKGADLDAAKAIGAFDDCIASTDTAGADALLRTRAGSAEEHAAAVALLPTLQNCLLKGQTVTLTPNSIRKYAADGLSTRFDRTQPVPAIAAGSKS